MRKSTATALTFVVATLATGVPVWMAVSESQRQGLDAETARVLGYARDVLLRSDGTADQAGSGIELLVQVQGADPCSVPALDLMRQIDLSSSYIQAIGHVRDGRMVCSSLGRDIGDMVLGEPDIITPSGVGIHKQIRFPFTPQHSFIALQHRGYAAIVHRDLPLDTTISDKKVSLAIYSLSERTPITSRGSIDPAWISRLGTGKQATFVDGRHVVAILKSERYLTASLAAIPVDNVNARTDEAALRLVPVGVIAGIALAVSLLMLARTQMALPAAIKAGLKRNEFYLLYQPIIDLQTGECVGAEALIRWKRATGELVDPATFIPIAEKSSLILLITQRVLELVARDAGSFLARHPEFHIAVNLSAQDLHSPALGRDLERLLRQTCAPASSFVLEITERGLVDVAAARGVTQEIRAAGYAIAIDDFGTGYSSLSYLEKLEVDFLKIDKSFVDAIATDAPTSQVVQHIIEMAKSLKLRMVAEGVETDAQAEFLRQRGVQFAQGWLFGKPATFAEVAQRAAAPVPA